MGYRDEANERIFVTRRFFDPAQMRMRDEEVPTVTLKIMKRGAAKGTAIDQTLGEVEMGSNYMSGSHYDFAPGSPSMRILRRTISIGSMATDGQVWWHLWHSRLGTVDSLGFRSNAQSPWISHGGPMNPLYALPPGTVKIIMQSLKGTHRVQTSMEAMI